MWLGQDGDVRFHLRNILGAAVLVAAPSFCFGQDEIPRLEGGESRPAKTPEGKLRRLSTADFWAHVGIQWEYPSPPPPEAKFSSPGTLDLVFGAPDVLVGGMTHVLSGLFHDSGAWAVREESQRSMTARMTGAIDVGPTDRPFDNFMSLLYDRESKYFSRWQESPLASFEVEAGEADIDDAGFMSEQRKVFVHALGRRYLGRYGDSLTDSLRKEALDFSRWQSADFVVGPAVLAGYLFMRGWEGRLNLGDVDCRVHLLPVERILGHFHKTDDVLVSAASLEFGIAGFPLKTIVSGGVVDGHATIDFIGFGTSIGMMRKTIKTELDPDLADR